MGQMKRAIAREENERTSRMEHQGRSQPDAKTHRVLMTFMEYRNGWRVSFLEADCQTSLPRKLTFASPDKIRTMQQRFGSQLLDDRNALEHGISIGRGGAWLTLNDEQYRKLMGA